MLGLLFFLGFGLAILWLAMVIYPAWMLTHPPRRTYAAAVARGRPGDPSELPGGRSHRSWSFKSRGLEFPVWEVRGDAPSGPTIVLTHGWADSRIGGLVRTPALATLASRIILWDLPGHGEAPGICTLGTREVADLQALLDQLGEAPVVLYGWSLGAGASLVAATQRPGIAAVIAEAPYRLPRTPARNVMSARGLPWRTNLGPALAALRAVAGNELAPEVFDRAAYASRVGCPLLVLHGECDEVCPLEDGRAIAGAARNGRLAVIRGARHNDLWTDPDFARTSTEAVREFLSAVTPTLTL